MSLSQRRQLDGRDGPALGPPGGPATFLRLRGAGARHGERVMTWQTGRLSEERSRG
jgi:hypothetical protein